MPRSPEDPKGPFPKISYPQSFRSEGKGQTEGREHMTEELLSLLQAHFGSDVKITEKNFVLYYNRYLKELLSSAQK